MLSACLIEDPPPYSEPQQTAPRLDLRRAVPLIDQVIVRNRGDLVPFNIPVSSEDAGDPLVAYLLLNYKGEGMGASVVGTTELKAGTLDDTDRVLTMQWVVDPALPRGCQRLTLQVAHRANLDLNTYPPGVVDKRDLAMAVWWANVEPDAVNAGMLQNCPLATEGAN